MLRLNRQPVLYVLHDGAVLCPVVYVYRCMQAPTYYTAVMHVCNTVGARTVTHASNARSVYMIIVHVLYNIVTCLYNTVVL